MRRWICYLMCLSIVLNLLSCGTFIYPERKGQTGGQVDSKVVLMDGLLCLLFIIPGVIAFIIDIDNGCIYLPGGYASLDETINLAGGVPQLQLEFFTSTGQSLGQPITVEYVSGTNQVANIKEIQQKAKGATHTKIYYQNKVVQVVELSGQTNSR